MRSEKQDIYHYAAERRGAAPPRRVLFLPGDGGWRGFAVTIAKRLAARGYDVYGWDTKRYLSAFTKETTLKESDVVGDFHQVLAALSAGTPGKTIVIGWSEGAGLALLAAASPSVQALLDGFIAIGMPEAAVLGWRWADNLTYITKRMPNEPTFSTGPYIPQVSPLPIAMIFSTGDEYVTRDQVKRLFATANEPKRFFLVTAQDHSYSGNEDGFFETLYEALRWTSTAGK